MLTVQQMNEYFASDVSEVSQDVRDTLNKMVETYLADKTEVSAEGNRQLALLKNYTLRKKDTGLYDKGNLKNIFKAYCTLTDSVVAKMTLEVAAKNEQFRIEQANLVKSLEEAAAEAAAAKKIQAQFRVFSARKAEAAVKEAAAKEAAAPAAPVAPVAPVAAAKELKDIGGGFYKDKSGKYYSNLSVVPVATAAATAENNGTFAFAFLGMPSFLDKMATSSVSVPKPVVAGVGTVVAVGALAMIAFGIAFATGDVSGFSFFAKLSFNAIVTASAVTAVAGTIAGVAVAVREKKAAATGAPLVITPGSVASANPAVEATAKSEATNRSSFLSFSCCSWNKPPLGSALNPITVKPGELQVKM